MSDIRAANAKHKNNQLNKTLQNFLFTMMADENEMAARKSLDVMMELYRRRVWCVSPFAHGSVVRTARQHWPG